LGGSRGNKLSESLFVATIAGADTMRVLPAENRIEAGARPGQARLGRRILFASAHSIVDFSNGASVATLDVLHGLTASGFECQAFCTSKLDFREEVQLEQIIGDLHDP